MGRLTEIIVLFLTETDTEPASFQQLLDDPLTPGLLPEPLEDEDRPDALSGDRGELSLGVCRQEEDVAAVSSAREQEGVEMAGLLELVEPSQGGDDALPRPPVFPAVLDDLEVGAWSGGLGAEEHGALVVETP